MSTFFSKFKFKFSFFLILFSYFLLILKSATAAETNQIDKNAEEKLNKKNCDWIISNDVSNKDIGFNSDYNEVTIHYKNKDVKKEKLSYKKKSGISDEIVDRIIDQLN